MRTDERWGIVRRVEVQRPHPTRAGVSVVGEPPYQCIIHGDLPGEYQKKTGQDRWALVEYRDGTKSWEPAWWFFDTGTHLEYQI